MGRGGEERQIESEGEEIQVIQGRAGKVADRSVLRSTVAARRGSAQDSEGMRGLAATDPTQPEG
jgi:hypothetical protein